MAVVAVAVAMVGVEEAWFHAGDGVTSVGSSAPPDASPLELPSPLLLLPLSAWSTPPWWMSRRGGWARGVVGGVGSGGSTMGPWESPLPGSDSTRMRDNSISSPPNSYSGKGVVEGGELLGDGLGVVAEEVQWSAGVGSSWPWAPGPRPPARGVTSRGVSVASEAAGGVGAAASNPGLAVTACTTLAATGGAALVGSGTLAAKQEREIREKQNKQKRKTRGETIQGQLERRGQERK